MLSDQHFLSCATALATSQPFHPTLFYSFSTVLLQVVLGLPLPLRPSGVHHYAVFRAVINTLSKYVTWPVPPSLLHLTALLVITFLIRMTFSLVYILILFGEN